LKTILRSLLWPDPSGKLTSTECWGYADLERLLNLTSVEQNVAFFMRDFYVGTGDAPSQKVVYDHFVRSNQIDESTYVEELTPIQPQVGSSFEQVYEDEVERQAVLNLGRTCREAIEIADQGVQMGKITVKGAEAAVSHLLTSVSLPKKHSTTGLTASMTQSQVALDELLEDARNDRSLNYGVNTGFSLFDESTNGIHKGELYVHAGFFGHLKTTSMFNMVVNSALSGWNPLVFEAEMPQRVCMLMCVAIHSGNPKFLGLGKPRLFFKKLLAGEIGDAEEAWFKEVHDDLVNNPQHGEIRIISQDEFTTWGSCVQRLMREHASKPVDIIWVDYITRMPVDPKYQRLDLIWGRNETIREMKQFSLRFNKGEGMPVATLFQINRDGWRKGLKEGGKLDKTSLYQYNAVEQEADIITYVWYDDAEKLASKPKLGMMKSRTGEAINMPQQIAIDVPSRRMSSLVTSGLTAPTSASRGNLGGLLSG